MPIRICVVHSQDEPDVLELVDGTYVLGRSPDGIQVRDATVSKVHAELCVDGNALSVTDLGSSYGTFDVSAKPITPGVRLEDGDLVRLGESQIVRLPPGDWVTPAAMDPLMLLMGLRTRSTEFLDMLHRCEQLGDDNPMVRCLRQLVADGLLISTHRHHLGARAPALRSPYALSESAHRILDQLLLQEGFGRYCHPGVRRVAVGQPMRVVSGQSSWSAPFVAGAAWLQGTIMAPEFETAVDFKRTHLARPPGELPAEFPAIEAAGVAMLMAATSTEVELGKSSEQRNALLVEVFRMLWALNGERQRLTPLEAQLFALIHCCSTSSPVALARIAIRSHYAGSETWVLENVRSLLQSLVAALDREPRADSASSERVRNLLVDCG